MKNACRWLSLFLMFGSLLGLLGCSTTSQTPCGDGEHYVDGTGAYCGYVVVRGGFECPAEFPFRLDLPSGAVVCSDYGPISRDDLPMGLCRTLGCDDSDGGADGGSDAGSDVVIADTPIADAETDSSTMSCDALEPATLSGGTPFGDVSLSLESLEVGDCITITGGRVQFSGGGAALSDLLLSFNYSVSSSEDGLRTIMDPVVEDIEITNGVMSAPATFRIEPTQWQEGADGAHLIDAVLTITGDGFSLNPVTLRGTFCAWPYYIC